MSNENDREDYLKELKEQREELKERVAELQEELEESVEELKNGTPSNIRWDVVLILGMWLIAAFLITFSSYGQENAKTILEMLGGTTILVIIFF